jgi:hypothetical protein
LEWIDRINVSIVIDQRLGYIKVLVQDRQRKGWFDTSIRALDWYTSYDESVGDVSSGS